MSYRRIRRVVLISCSQCSGRGFVATKNGYVKCCAPGCVDGNVERYITEIITVEDGAA